MSDKSQQRADMRTRRKHLAGRNPEAGERVADPAGQRQKGAVVALYRAMGSELDTDVLAVALEAAGRQLCLPVVLERDAPMIFRAWSPGEPLELDAAGCPAPLPLAQTVDPDLILTPLLRPHLRGTAARAAHRLRLCGTGGRPAGAGRS
jgi:5-formyltetrahydrofolate cyclo-ligase